VAIDEEAETWRGPLEAQLIGLSTTNARRPRRGGSRCRWPGEGEFAPAIRCMTDGMRKTADERREVLRLNSHVVALWSRRFAVPVGDRSPQTIDGEMRRRKGLGFRRRTGDEEAPTPRSPGLARDVARRSESLRDTYPRMPEDSHQCRSQCLPASDKEAQSPEGFGMT
jgi:hypothetical protein